MKDLHTVSMLPGSQNGRSDRLRMLLATVAFIAGAGAVTAIAAGTPGAGYDTIPTVAFANVGEGTSATATARMGVVANPTIAAAGSGGDDGAVTLTGTTGTGTKFQVTGTIAGGVLTAITGISVAGVYSAMPSAIAAEPVTGGNLTGATVNLSAALGVVSYVIGAGGTLYPATGVTATLTGGTPSTAAAPGAVTVTSAAGAHSVNAINSADIPGLAELPDAYNVQVSLDKDATAIVTAKTSTGFTLTVNPRLAASTLTAGSADILITC